MIMKTMLVHADTATANVCNFFNSSDRGTTLYKFDGLMQPLLFDGLMQPLFVDGLMQPLLFFN